MDRSHSIFIAWRARWPTASTRRSVLLGTAASIIGAGLFATPALAQLAISAADSFLKLSHAVIGHNNLDPVTAARIFNAMSKVDSGFAGRVDECATVEAENAARQRGWERYAAPYRTLQQNVAILTDRHGAEVRRRRAAEAECAALRERLAALDPAPERRPTR